MCHHYKLDATQDDLLIAFTSFISVHHCQSPSAAFTRPAPFQLSGKTQMAKANFYPWIGDYCPPGGNLRKIEVSQDLPATYLQCPVRNGRRKTFVSRSIQTPALLSASHALRGKRPLLFAARQQALRIRRALGIVAIRRRIAPKLYVPNHRVQRRNRGSRSTSNADPPTKRNRVFTLAESRCRFVRVVNRAALPRRRWAAQVTTALRNAPNGQADKPLLRQGLEKTRA